jgi:hypothetical protein
MVGEVGGKRRKTETDRETESGDEVEPDPRWPITSSPLAWKIFADSRLQQYNYAFS